jgi:hypothetical protein
MKLKSSKLNKSLKIVFVGTPQYRMLPWHGIIDVGKMFLPLWRTGSSPS